MRLERKMPAKKKKRKYTFRKGKIIPYESGSLIHITEKAQRETFRALQKALKGEEKKRRKK